MALLLTSAHNISNSEYLHCLVEDLVRAGLGRGCTTSGTAPGAAAGAPPPSSGTTSSSSSSSSEIHSPSFSNQTSSFYYEPIPK